MRARAPLLFVTVFVIATSGLVYELIAGTLASYVLGDSVTQFSTTIGVYLFAMGVGAYLSRFVVTRLAARFVHVELGAALVGGCSAPFLFVAFAHGTAFLVALYATVLAVGILVGLELPLLMRILRDELDFRDLVAKALTVDYLGALLGSVLFALWLVPTLGLTRTSLLFGLLNALVALGSTWVLGDLLGPGSVRGLRARAALVAALLLGGLVLADRLTAWTEDRLYADPVVYAEQSPYQRIVLTARGPNLQLFLNGNLQFSTSDEHRYHEALVHPAMSAAPRRAEVLVLGGGDGLAARELLKYDDVHALTLVDLDPTITALATTLPALRRANADALHDPRVRVVNEDAMVWLRSAEATASFDVIVADFPDPNSFSLGKLYTTAFYRLTRAALRPDGVLVVQATSPLEARRSFWCIERTLAAVGFETLPYHAVVPSFGEWGYVLASRAPLHPPTELRVDALRYLTAELLPALFVFPEDMRPLPVEANRLNDQRLVHYYEDEWAALD